MAYDFVVLPDAEKQLRAMGLPLTRRILNKLLWIAKQSQPMRYAVRLHHSKIGDVRFRIGDYRVIAILDDEKRRLAIVAIGHRREIYR